jgi:hypothetical protein
MGVLIKMPEMRFERTSFKTRQDAIILTKCKKCGARQVASLGDGSVHEWEKNHRCESVGAANVMEKKSSEGLLEVGMHRFWGTSRPSLRRK